MIFLSSFVHFRPMFLNKLYPLPIVINIVQLNTIASRGIVTGIFWRHSLEATILWMAAGFNTNWHFKDGWARRGSEWLCSLHNRLSASICPPRQLGSRLDLILRPAPYWIPFVYNVKAKGRWIISFYSHILRIISFYSQSINFGSICVTRLFPYI